MSFERSTAGIARQVAKPFCAAASARSRSALPACATRPISAPVAGLPTGDPHERQVGLAEPSEPLLLLPVDGELRPRRSSSTSSAESSPRAAGLPPRRRGGRARPRARARRRRRRAARRARTSAGGGQNRGGDADGDGPREERDERRADPAQVEVLERVDVGDHAREQVALPVALELRRARAARAARRPATRTRPSDAEREVVGGEPLEVAGERPREAEEAHGDDRHRQREDAGRSAAREIR